MTPEEELKQLREERDQLKLQLEWQVACTNSLLESQDRLAVYIGELKDQLSSTHALIREVRELDN